MAAGMPGTRAAGSCRVQRAVVYQRRRPERSVAQQEVQQSLETWLARRSADWCGSVAGVVRRVVWAAKSGLSAVCIFRLFRVSNLCEHRTKVVFGLELMVGGGEHKVVLGKIGCRAWCADVNWGLNFLSVQPWVCAGVGGAYRGEFFPPPGTRVTSKLRLIQE